MTGFFTKEETQSVSRPGGKSVSCASCGLYRYVLSPRMEPFGNFRKGILNLGEAPGEREDRKGRQWQGRAGRVLLHRYADLGIDLFEDCININTVNCRPTKSTGANRAPTPLEIAACRSRVLSVVQEYKPHLIIALGGPAVSCLIGHRWGRDMGGISKWRGWRIPDRDFNAWVCPTFHPSFVMRSTSGKKRAEGREIETIWKQDLEAAFSLIDTPLPVIKDDRSRVEIIDSLEPLNDIKEGPVSFDYETTGLKPHADGHRIVCASVTTANRCFSFLMPASLKARRPFINLLQNSNIGKMAHNMKFEDNWTNIRLRSPVDFWEWDSMLAAHILDNRPGITSLKFQAYVHFGVVDYESTVSSYLKSQEGEKNANAFNRVLEVLKDPVLTKELLIYCGLDSLYEYELAMLQRNLIGA